MNDVLIKFSIPKYLELVILHCINIYCLKLNALIYIGKKQAFHYIRITCPCNKHPFTPRFYIEKVGFTRVYIFLLFLLQNIDCVPTIYVLSKNQKNIKKNYLKIIIFTAVKYCCILHGRVCVMMLVVIDDSFGGVIINNLIYASLA